MPKPEELLLLRLAIEIVSHINSIDDREERLKLVDSLNDEIDVNLKELFEKLKAQTRLTLNLKERDLDALGNEFYKRFHRDKAASTKRMGSIRKYNPGKRPHLLQQLDESYTRGVSDRIAVNPFFWLADDLEQLPGTYQPKTGTIPSSSNFLILLRNITVHYREKWTSIYEIVSELPKGAHKKRLLAALDALPILGAFLGFINKAQPGFISGLVGELRRLVRDQPELEPIRSSFF